MPDFKPYHILREPSGVTMGVLLETIVEKCETRVKEQQLLRHFCLYPKTMKALAVRHSSRDGEGDSS